MVYEARSPLDPRRLPDLPAVAMLGMREAPSQRDAMTLRSAIRTCPSLTLRFHGVTDLSLEHLKSFRLRGLEIDGCRGFDLTQLHALPRIESLALRNCSFATTIRSLQSLPILQALRLEGMFDHVDTLHECAALRDLDLNGTALPNFQAGYRLEALQLRNLETGDNLPPLPRSLTTLTLSGLSTLRRLPDLTHMNALAHLRLWGLPGIVDLAPLLGVSGLRTLEITRMPHLRVHDVFPIAAMGGLRELSVSLGGRRKDREVHRAFAAARPQSADAL